MSDREAGEPLHSVLAAARTIDPAFTEVTLKKWRDGGLVPRPFARPGRGRKGDNQGGRGAIYPVGTSTHLQHLLELRAAAREAGRRFRPEQALWQVWWSGGYGRLDVIRDQLRHQTEARVQTVDSISSRMDRENDPERATTIFDELAQGSVGLGLSQARERLGKDAFPTLLYFLFNLARGSFPGFTNDDPVGHVRKVDDPDDRHIFERGVGLDRARHDRIGTAQPWLRGPLTPQLQDFANLVSPAALEEALEITTDRDLEEARNEVQALVGILYSLRLTLESMRGPGAFGLTGVLHPNDLDASGQRQLLLGWLAFRQHPEVWEGFHVIIGTAGAVAPLETFIDLTRSAATRELPRHLPPDQDAADREGPQS